MALGAAGLALVLGLSACGDIVLGPVPRSDLVFEPGHRLDFGAVEVGKKQVLTLELVNRGTKPVTFELVPPTAPWSWDLPPGQDTLVLEGRGPLAEDPGIRIRFGFLPGADLADGSVQKGQAILRAPGEEHVIQLEGRALVHPVDCGPTSLFFGYVVVGEDQVRTVRCTNDTSYPVQILVPAPKDAWGERFVVDRDVPQQEIPANGRLDIPVRFMADGQGGPAWAYLPILAADTLVPLVPGDGIRLEGHVVPTHVVQFGDGSPGQTLDFGFTPVDATRELILELRNLYDREVTASAFWEDPDDPDFAYELPRHDLGPVPEVELLRVRFTPQAPGARTARLHVRIQRHDAAEATEDVIVVRGFGGGPVIACEPDAVLDFGRVAVGSMVRRTITCHNAGVDLPVDEDDLELVGASAQYGTLFPLQVFRGEGGLFGVAVDYRPVASGLDLDDLTLVTCTGAGCSTPERAGLRLETDTHIQLTGTGIDVLPGEYCDAAFDPPALDFGRVTPGVPARLAVRVVNRGAHDCYLQPLDLAGDGVPAFALPDAPTGHWTLGPGASLSLPVDFRPDAVPPGEVAATAGFWMSNPSRPHLELPLHGVAGAAPCLALEPPFVDFTADPERAVDPAVACGAPDLRVKVRSRCAGEWQVTAIGPAAGSDPAFVVSAPGTLPAHLAQGVAHEFAVDFRPATPGTLDGGFRIEAEGPAGQREVLLLPTTGRAEEGGRWFDRFPIVKPKLDLLLVVSSSAAMSGTPVTAQLASATGISQLRAGLDRPDLDWQVGVTSTDLAPPGTQACAGGVWNGGEAGRLVPGTGGRSRLLSPALPDFAGSFAANVAAVRACTGGVERAFDAAVLAVSEPLISQDSDPRFPPYGLGNRGLSRDGAHLAVVFVSAGEDASARSPGEVATALATRKAAGLYSIWAIVGDPLVGCTFASGGVAAPGNRYREASGEVMRSVCASGTWGGLWATVASRAAKSQSAYPLAAKASTTPSPIEVRHVRPNGTWSVLTGGYSYDAARGTLVLGSETLQGLLESGGSLEVRYRLSCD